MKIIFITLIVFIELKFIADKIVVPLWVRN